MVKVPLCYILMSGFSLGYELTKGISSHDLCQSEYLKSAFFS